MFYNHNLFLCKPHFPCIHIMLLFLLVWKLKDCSTLFQYSFVSYPWQCTPLIDMEKKIRKKDNNSTKHERRWHRYFQSITTFQLLPQGIWTVSVHTGPVSALEEIWERGTILSFLSCCNYSHQARLMMGRIKLMHISYTWSFIFWDGKIVFVFLTNIWVQVVLDSEC